MISPVFKLISKFYSQDMKSLLCRIPLSPVNTNAPKGITLLTGIRSYILHAKVGEIHNCLNCNLRRQVQIDLYKFLQKQVIK